MMSAPAEAKRMTCPACGRFLCTVDAVYVEAPPCQCGYQTTIRAVGRRARQEVQTPAGRIEVK